MTVSRSTYRPFTGTLSESNALRRGLKGQQVSDMQRMLKAAGFNPGPLDGKFGPLTERALKAYQSASGQRVDGTLGLTEYQALQQRSGFTPGASAPTNLTGAGDVRSHSTGATGTGSAQEMLQRALAQRGDRYVFGHEVNLNDANPNTFDCSELVEWAVHQAGGSIPDGSQNQRRATTRISVAEAARTPGALLFNGHHVAISLGDGVHTIEARGARYGVVIGTIGNRFEDGGLVKSLRY